MIEKTKKQTLKYQGHIIRVREDEVEMPDGSFAKRDVVEHPGGAAIALKDEDGKYFIVQQYRYAQEKVMIEFPAGKLNPGEDPLESIQRETIEETGYRAKNIRYLGVMAPTPGYAQEKIYMYHGEVGEYLGQQLDEDEVLSVERWSLNQIIDAIKNGVIEDAKTIIMALMIQESK